MKNPKTPVTRRDATGHLDPQYERELLAVSHDRENHGMASAFIARPEAGDALGEELGVAFLQSATSGEGTEQERQDRLDPEEYGGPFAVSSAFTEITNETDEASDLGPELPGEPGEPSPLDPPDPDQEDQPRYDDPALPHYTDGPPPTIVDSSASTLYH